jgi:hypothetical protein
VVSLVGSSDARPSHEQALLLGNRSNTHIP